MAGGRAAAGLVLTAVALTAGGCSLGSSKTATVTQTHTVTTTKTVTTTGAAAARPCTGDQLTGTFAVVPGSAGAGQIGYALTLKNTSRSPCSLQGLPTARLIGASGSALPTHVRAAGPGRARRILLEPGASALADARLSPDIAGTGDSQTGPCQPQAQTLEVTPNGGGITDAPIKPPTSVCQGGTLTFETYGYLG